MNKKSKSHEALECGHCGIKNRMQVLAGALHAEVHTDDGSSREAGTMYEVQSCPACNKVVLVGGPWHEGMEEPEDCDLKVVLPESDDRVARQLLEQKRLDQECMSLAVSEAKKCIAEAGSIKPKVGAVVAHNNKRIASSYRGEVAPGEHAEFILLEKKCQDDVLVGATVYTTLEPCTTRNSPKIPCADRLISRKVARVVIGMLDPDERIRGRGVLALRKANIRVDLFPPDLMSELEEMNRAFITEKEHPGQSAPVASSLSAQAMGARPMGGLTQLTIVSSISTGAFQTPPSHSHDNNTATRYTNDGSLSSASITYTLSASTSVLMVRLLMHRGTTRRYPIRVAVGSVMVFTGLTSLDSGYWEVFFPAVTGNTVTVTMTAANSDGNSWFSVVDAQIWGI